MQVFGVDIGGSGIKAGLVDTQTGKLVQERHRVATPIPAAPLPVAHAIAELVNESQWKGPIGVGFPAVVRHGITRSAANVDIRWIGTDAAKLFSQATGCPVIVVNDADAAGLAEMTFGAGRGRNGSVLIITIGTGLGTALFVDGRLVPNLEMGHIEIRCKDAERRASDAARKRKKLSWQAWGERFDEYLHTINHLLNPDLIILGGGAVKKLSLFRAYLTVDVEIVPAQNENNAGVIGAALTAARAMGSG